LPTKIVMHILTPFSWILLYVECSVGSDCYWLKYQYFSLTLIYMGEHR